MYDIIKYMYRPDVRVFTLHWVFIALKSIAGYTSSNGIVYNNWKDIWTGTIKYILLMILVLCCLLILSRALQYRIAEDTGYELLSTLLVVSIITVFYYE